jgi:hypothetical protein
MHTYILCMYVCIYYAHNTVTSSPAADYEDNLTSSLSYQVAEVDLSDDEESPHNSDGEDTAATRLQHKLEDQQNTNNNVTNENKNKNEHKGTETAVVPREGAASGDLELERAIKARQKSAQFLAKVLGERSLL